jgi:uncharacterized protein
MTRRLLWRVAIIVASLYLLACVALYTLQRSLLYFPSPLSMTPDAKAIAIPASGSTLHGWVVNPGQRDAVIYFGGKGERVERDADFFRRTLPKCSVYLIPYRGYGPNAGKPTETGLFADALVEYAFVHAEHAHVSLIGRSLGTGVATYVASRRDVEKLVLVTPYDSILNIARARYPMFPVSLLLADRYESWRYASAIHAPVLVILAEHDHAVPRSNSDVLIGSFQRSPTVVVIPHSDHNNLSNSPLYASSVTDFMRDREAMPPAIPSPPR